MDDEVSLDLRYERVYRLELLVDLDPAGKRGAVAYYLRGGVGLHPPEIGGRRGDLEGIRHRLQLRVVDHEVDHRPELLDLQFAREHHGPGSQGERPPAAIAFPPKPLFLRLPIGYDVG